MRDQHFLVLATQRLTALRDKILCPNDYVSNKDMSEDPSVLAEEQLKDVPTSRAKSAFFFVGNTFYNDRRDCESRDVSRYVLENLCCCDYWHVLIEGLFHGQRREAGWLSQHNLITLIL